MEIKFKRDTAFRKQFFVPDSFAHPAKMDAQLLIWIVSKYTRLGEIILDPMAGSGTTMLACTLARNVILVELEEKFCKMMRDNWEQVSMRPQLGCEMGLCDIKQGDARDLGGLFAGLIPKERRLPQQVDKIVTSPPYAESVIANKKTKQFLAKAQENIRKGKSKAHPITKERLEIYDEHCIDNPHNIGNLPYGEIDKIITSPPFGGAEASDDRKTFNPTHHAIGQGSLKTDHYDKGNLANLPYGNIDSIITSPPYEEAMGSKHHSPRADRMMAEGIQGMSYTEVGNRDNIGNLKSQSYLEAMLQVYQQCYKVLRAGGLMVLVVKNFLREQKEIRLDTDTIALCEQAGFQFIERHYRRLPSQSFWRVIYAKKYPDAPVIDKEDVLVFRRLT